MRKRTYTALVSSSDLCGPNGENNTCVKRMAGSSLDTHKEPDSCEGITPHSTFEEEDGDSDIPLTTIHNLVGTCEIASSTVPIDLEYVYKCLPNRYPRDNPHNLFQTPMY
jgi:hypothetical protein